MKVLHINCNYMGTPLHQKMLERLDSLGVDSTVFAPVSSLQNAAIKPRDNVVPCKCFGKWDRLVFYYKQHKIQKALEKNIPVSDYDIMHAYTLYTDGNCAYKMHQKYGTEYVVAIRNTDVNSFFKWRPHLIKRGIRIMQSAKCIFFLSESYKQRVLNQYVPAKYRSELENKSYILPNGIDDFWLENLQTDVSKIIDSSVKLVYAGRIDINKNITTTQAAMKILRAKGYNISLTVVGKVIDQGVFKQISSDENTTYFPAMDKTELIHMYRDNHIFVMPSFAESFGLVYVEAISQGLPVVYSAGQGFDMQFAEGEVGYRADPHSAESVAEAIEKIVLNYNQIVRDLPPKAESYNWNRICCRYCELYESGS